MLWPRRVFQDTLRVVEDLNRVEKVDFVLLQIGFALYWIPIKRQVNSPEENILADSREGNAMLAPCLTRFPMLVSSLPIPPP